TVVCILPILLLINAMKIAIAARKHKVLYTDMPHL
ncbi:MAG: hypothetical protein ACI935_003294, partial [Moritella dasanensis]